MDTQTQTWRIRPATIEDIPDCKKIVDKNSSVFGFIQRSVFEESAKWGFLLVAEQEDQIVGFVRFYHRKKDTQTTLYDIGVQEDQRSRGIGRSLLDTLVEQCFELGRTVISLKCPTDLPANTFYAQYGFDFQGTVQGRIRELNVWELELDPEG